MRNAGLDEAQAGIKIAWRNINNLRYADYTTLMTKWRGTKEPIDESERRQWKSWLKAQHSENKDHGIRSHHFMANRWGNSGNSGWLYFWGLQNADGDCSHEIKRHLLLGRKVMTKLDSIFKSRHYFVNKGPSSQGYSFYSSHVWMWELDYKESEVQKNCCFWTVVLEKTLESPLDCKEIKPVHPKGNQFWVFIGRTDGEAETPIFWPPDAKSWLIWKDPHAGKDWGQEEMAHVGRDWGQEEKGMTEDDMARWHHWLDGYEFG